MGRYSQSTEENFLPEGDGTYLEIGSYDGRTFSNTRLLAERGWKGVCIEPSAYAFAAMLDDPPPHATLVHALVGPRTGLASFQVSKDAVSSTSRAHARKWSQAAEFQRIFTVSVSVPDLLKDFPGPFRLVSIDTEGTSVWLFHELAPHFDDLETEVVIVEHDGHHVHAPGFTEVHRTAENAILERR